MDGNKRKFWGGIALLVLAGALLFAPVTLGGLASGSAAVAVLGLAAGAVLVGTSLDGRPV